MGNESKALEKSLRWVKDQAPHNDDGSWKYEWSIPALAARELIVHYSPQNETFPEGTYREIVSLAVNRWLKFKKYQEKRDITKSYKQAFRVEENKVK